MHPIGGRGGVEHVIVAEDFTFAAALAMADDVTGLGFPANDAVDALTFCSLGLGDQTRFRFGFAFAFGFDRLAVQALLGPAFDHLCPRLFEWVHARLSQCDLGLAVPSCWVNNRDDYICGMCGRIIQSSGPLRYAIVDGMNVRDNRVHNYPPRWNGAPSQELLVIRRNHHTRNVSLDPLRWGLIPYWCTDPTGGRKPINAKCETVRDLPSFRDAYRRRRCIVPVDGFFEWKAIKGQKAKQPYAIAMKDGAPFGIAGIWENWKDSASGEWTRTFAVITTDANELIADIHDRMPVILSRYDYVRWLGEESDPRDLMRPFPTELMRIWPISTRVNKPENDDPSILDPMPLTTDAA